MLRVAWDVDDTLIRLACAMGFDIPNYETIYLFHWFKAQGAHLVIWSGGGASYAKSWADKLGLIADEYLTKEPGRQVDLVFDDSDLTLARVNVKVRRPNNHIVWFPDDVPGNDAEP